VTAGLQAARTTATPAPAELQRETRQSAWATARSAFPPRPASNDWPAIHYSRDRVLGLLARPPFAVDNPGSQRWRFRGGALAVAWLADQPGDTWQQRWLASGAESAGKEWKRGCARWLDSRGVHVGQRLDLLSVGLILAMAADIIRPSLSWLAAPGVSTWALARTLQRVRDPARFARLREAISHASELAVKARHVAIGRAAVIVAARGGTLTEVTAGDFLELLDAEPSTAAGLMTTARCHGGCCARLGCSDRARRCRWLSC
jgi:hypothetical protein